MKLHLIVSAVIISTSINAYSSDVSVEKQSEVEQVLANKQQDVEKSVDKDYRMDGDVKIELELQKIIDECKLMFPACDN
jgi:hypothetical protein